LPFRSDRACSPLIITAVPGRKYCIAIGDREIEKFIIRQPPINFSNSLSPIAMQYLRPGTAVIISGLQARSDLKGKAAAVVSFNVGRERYRVKTKDGEEEVVNNKE